MRQALSAARRIGANETQQSMVVQRVLALLQEIQPHQNPPEIAYRVHRIVRDTIEAPDPYREVPKKP